MKKVWILMGVVMCCSLLISVRAQAEDKTSIAAGPAETVSDADMQWLWGEIVAINGPGKTVTVKYVDYETDQEKQKVIACDDATSYENIASYSEIKIGDTVSIDYLTRTDGVNLARVVSLEKLDDTDVLNEAESSMPAATDEKP